MTPEQVESCYTARIGTPGSPSSIVPAWIAAFGEDGLPPPPSLFIDAAAAFAWIAANWTSPNPCA